MTTSSMVRGVAAMLLACTFWAGALAVPELVAVGTLGILAARSVGGGLPALVSLHRGSDDAPLDWRRAFAFAAAGHVGYYALALVAIGLAGAPIVMAIIGLSPVVLAVAERRVAGLDLRPLAWPLVGSLVGLLVLGTRDVAAPPGGTAALAVGVALTLVAEGAWCAYAISNARHLRRNPALSSRRWASAVAVAAMVLATPVVFVVGTRTPAVGLPPLLAVGLVVGVGGSWLAVSAFGEGTRLLPPGLAGQLLVAETVFGLAIVAVVRGVVPDPVTVAAVALLVTSVAGGVRTHRRGVRPARRGRGPRPRQPAEAAAAPSGRGASSGAVAPLR